MDEAGYVYSIWSTKYQLPLGYFISVHFMFVGSPLSYCMLIFELMRNLYTYNA